MSTVSTNFLPRIGADPRLGSFLANDLEDIAITCHQANVNAGWWHVQVTPEMPPAPIHRNVGELIALAHSELSEALEGDRKDLMDDKLPQYKMLHVELIDAVIRILDLAVASGAPVGIILRDKLAYNARRLDHKPEYRALPGGKSY